MTGYDIIGDIHGNGNKLQKLLEKLGYKEQYGYFQHENRKAVFLGDLIDRGDEHIKTINIVRDMVKNKLAFAVMGNHEFNAICYATKLENGDYIRDRNNNKHYTQHAKFLDDYPVDSNEYIDVINWFKTLPIFMEFEGFNVIHACWSEDAISRVRPYLNDDNTIKDKAYIYYADKKSNFFSSVKKLLKGPEYKLPLNCHFFDKDGNKRKKARIKWWVDDREPAINRLELGHMIGDKNMKNNLVNTNINYLFAQTEKPVFFGHYWFSGIPAPLNKKVACLDYSVGKQGKLVAYRWSGEDSLKKENFCWV